ncbi:MAG: DUF222 domain-containing protein [Acidimicrobiaceae bacterium]|nr:DUF222 domain-containing protein [Acidimicrobiaceae bacterium]
MRKGLAELIRLTNDLPPSTSELQALLAECKAIGSQLAVLQADATRSIMTRERHGDSGVGVLAQSAGLSLREAAEQVKTVNRLQSMPLVRDAMENGRISLANAKTLVRTSDKTSSQQVDNDTELLEQAAEMPVEKFVKEANRWAIKRQHDDGEGDYRRQRRKRHLSIWNGNDGMVHLRGELDPITGAKVRKRFFQEAERLRRDDLKNPGGEKRNYNQRMADALDTLTGTLASHRDISSNDLCSNSSNGSRNGTNASSGTDIGKSGNNGTGGGSEYNGNSKYRGSKCQCNCLGQPSADITIVQHLSADDTATFTEIADGSTIPPSVFEEHFCNAEVRGVVFSHKGVPLWHGYTKRLATKAQLNVLRAKYGGCGGCDANMWMCQSHHIKPISQGGTTNIDNMMLLCWTCHRNVHNNHWKVVPDGRGLYTLKPPRQPPPLQQVHHGHANTPDPPLVRT